MPTKRIIKKSNIKQSILEGLERTPEEVFAYIYGVMHCPIYRRRYIEFLKTDFPAVPFTKDRRAFDAYAFFGQELMDLHTMEDCPSYDEIYADCKGGLEEFLLRKIIPPKEPDKRLVLQTTDGKEIIFHGVTPVLYEFQIGSYAPVDHWLKCRKKDAVLLTPDDIEHVRSMLCVIKRTIEITKQIEELKQSYLTDMLEPVFV